MKLKKLIITFFLLPAAFGYAQTQSTQIIACLLYTSDAADEL